MLYDKGKDVYETFETSPKRKSWIERNFDQISIERAQNLFVPFNHPKSSSKKQNNGRRIDCTAQKIERQKSIFKFATRFAKKRTTPQGDVARAPHRCHSIRRGLTNKTWYHVYIFSQIFDIKLSETNNTPTRVHRKRHHLHRAATPRRRVVRR